MTTSQVHRDDARVVPEWELQDRLRRALRMLPMSVQEVAEVLGVRRETVGTWINGHRKPSHTTLMIIADMTGVELDWLKYGETRTAALQVVEGGGEKYAIRDSNPEPADMESRRSALRLVSVNGGLTVDRLPGGWWPSDPDATPREPENGGDDEGLAGGLRVRMVEAGAGPAVPLLSKSVQSGPRLSVVAS